MECTAQIQQAQQQRPLSSLVDDLDMSLSFIKAYTSIIDDMLCNLCGEMSESDVTKLQEKLFAMNRSICVEMDKAMDKSSTIYRRVAGH